MSKKYMIIVVIVIFLNHTVTANVRYGYTKPIAKLTINDLSIVSFSQKWSNITLLRELYNELLNNYHHVELEYLKNIYIYPDSPDNNNGYYHPDISIDNKSAYTIGKNCYIELFDGDNKNTVAKIALTLSHEYGHHFTLFHILKSEKLYYNKWSSSKYVKIRNLEDNNNVIYSIPSSKSEYIYYWDIAEIAADDYVQIFGSKAAKQSFIYKDIIQRLEENITSYYYNNTFFNARPQGNMYIPLAADIPELMAYWYQLSKSAPKEQYLYKKPEITITGQRSIGSNMQYKITWSEAVGNGPFEYTLVSNKYQLPTTLTPIKTLNTGDKLEAYIGTASKQTSNGKINVIRNNYKGLYEFRIHVKDRDGFMYSSEPLSYYF